MCGISAIIGENQELVRTSLKAMVAAQLHRGPDDSGEHVLPFGRKFLGLGHRRLSIIDLSPLGHQPMVHPVTGDQIIFNGEIYNFKKIRDELLRAGETFKGHSDTEVLLHALSRFGASCLNQLEGMYSFIYLNARRNTLLVARDPLGIKPLYVCSTGGVSLFASEVRSILATGLIPSKLSQQGVASYMAYGAVQEPYTLVENVRSFPAGHYQEFSADQGSAISAPIPFWRYPGHSTAVREREVIGQIRSTLDAAVRDHMVSDVPVGMFLSSGLDSSIIAGLAMRHTSRLRTFTVGFSDEVDLSELVLASESAKLWNMDHTEIVINKPDAEQTCHAWLESLDQPSIDGLNVYLISKVVRAQGIVVALSGLGGDELFGGYPSFTDVPRAMRFLKTVAWLPPSLRGSLAHAMKMHKGKAISEKYRDMALGDGGILDLYLHRRRTMSDSQLSLLGIDPVALGMTASVQDPEVISQLNIDKNDPVWTISQLESRFYQGNMLLRDGDTNGMANSLEIRVPMLDRRMLDLMYSIPGNVRLPGGRADKHLLKMAFPDLLRNSLTTQAKRGFTLPIRRWMHGPMRPLCEDAINSLKTLGLMSDSGIDAVWKEFMRAPETPIWSRAFALCVLGHYIRRTGLS